MTNAAPRVEHAEIAQRKSGGLSSPTPVRLRYSAPEQRELERAVCKAPCVLLAGHSGRCVQSNGKYMKRNKNEQPDSEASNDQ